LSDFFGLSTHLWGIKYASKLGFEPQKISKISKYVLEKQSKVKKDATIEFGENGKPFFIVGPNDDADLIIKKLEKSGQRKF